MADAMTDTVVISLGGSLVVPDAIDTDFLGRLKTLIEAETASGRRFILITGGGKTARRYAEAAAAVVPLEKEDLDWLGIHATRLNAHLIRTIFRDLAHYEVIANPDDILDVPKTAKLIVASGYRPGSSTDLRAIQIAERVGASKVINLSNISHVYTADPKTDPTAEKIEDITWAEFRKIIPSEWAPGLNSPFDPVAAKAAEASGIEVAAVAGDDFTALTNYLAGEPFAGTRIHA
jgi:uridylate kinase